MINSRDPPNKFFESTVNWANKDAWKRRSIYLSKAQAFVPQNQETRRTVVTTLAKASSLNRDDSTDDELWNNVDENIGEYDRVIPSISTPKWMKALLDNFLPESISNLLRNSTRFSHSFHVGGNPKNRDSSFRNSKFNSSKKENIFEENKTYENRAENNGFYGYQKFSEVKRQNTLKSEEDTWDFTEEKWIREKSLKQQRDSLKNFENDPIRRMTNLQSSEDGQNEMKQTQDIQDISIRKIEEIDDKKRALSEISMKPKKNLNSMVSKVVSPFAAAPGSSKEEKNQYGNNDKIERTNSSNSNNEDRTSVDVWRASETNDKRISDIPQQQEGNNEEILDQWLKTRGRNGTIIEDPEAENQTESNRFSKTSFNTENNRESEIEKQQEPEVQQNEEEENELHKIHMLQSLQALQYMKKVPLPAIEELKEKMVFLPPPKQPHIK